MDNFIFNLIVGSCAAAGGVFVLIRVGRLVARALDLDAKSRIADPFGFFVLGVYAVGLSALGVAIVINVGRIFADLGQKLIDVI